MGRTKLTDEQQVERLKNSIIAGKHIKAYRKSQNWSQEKCAEEWGTSEATIRRYEANIKIAPGQKQEFHPVSERTAKKIEEKTGIIYPYWMGETECKTWGEEIEWQEWIAEDPEIAELEQRRIMFYECGYHYELLHDAAHDFSECSPVPDSDIVYQSYHPHQLTSFQEPDKHYYFNQEELDALINQLKDTIAFACFKKERATQQKERQQDGNGNTGM